MTSMTTLAPVAPVMPASAVTARAGAPSALQASAPSFALQGAVAGSSFAGLLAASAQQGSAAPVAAPAPAQTPSKPGTAQGGSQASRRRVDEPGTASADQIAQTAGPNNALPAKVGADDAADADMGDAPAAEATDAADDPADVAGTTDERSAPSHRSRKASPAAAAEGHAVAAGASPVTPPSPDVAVGTSHGVDAAASDGAASSIASFGEGRQPSHGLIGKDTATGAAVDTTSLQAAAAMARDDKAAGIAGQPDPRAIAQTAAADVVAAAVQASGAAAAPASAFASATDARDNVGAAGAASAASAVDLRSGATSVAGPASVVVATPTDAPDFRDALGAQVSLLVKDGVQTAELHLNPADMGPISVHIAMDGAQAKIDFGADSADTRRLIETGLPELASALRDAGFTLSGGGVSDHRQGRPNGDADARGSDATRRVDVTDDTLRRTVSAASLRRSGSGGLDLYA